MSILCDTSSSLRLKLLGLVEFFLTQPFLHAVYSYSGISILRFLSFNKQQPTIEVPLPFKRRRYHRYHRKAEQLSSRD